jgi:hypothetical protein
MQSCGSALTVAFVSLSTKPSFASFKVSELFATKYELGVEYGVDVVTVPRISSHNKRSGLCNSTCKTELIKQVEPMFTKPLAVFSPKCIFYLIPYRYYYDFRV